MDSPRILSLLPAATEVICRLGLGGALVGRSHACDHPASVRRLPACTRSTLDDGCPGQAVNQQVEDRLHRALSLFEVDEARVKALAPDVVVTQAQCEVCAVHLSQVRQMTEDWCGPGTTLHSFTPTDLGGFWQEIRSLGEALGVADRAGRLVEELRGRMETVRHRAQRLPDRPTVACLEWLDPLMGAGNWVPELVDWAGGRPVLGEAGRHSPWASWEDLEASDPDLIVLMPCGWGFERAARESQVFNGHPSWRRLRAVRAGAVYGVDALAYFTRPGPRLADSLEIMAEVMHPEVFGCGREGKDWCRLFGSRVDRKRAAGLHFRSERPIG